MRKKKVSVSWSGGKDSALALYRTLQEAKFEVVSLHTSIDAVSKKVGLHGVSETLIAAQAQSIGLPLEKLYINQPQKPLSYEETLHLYYHKLKQQNVHGIISGDIYLEDLRIYKENLVAEQDLEIIFPLWGLAADVILDEFFRAGFRTKICAANDALVPEEMVGADLRPESIRKLPAKVDPCGENGEYHSFVYTGPIFRYPLKLENGARTVEKHVFMVMENGGSMQKELTYHYVDFKLN